MSASMQVDLVTGVAQVQTARCRAYFLCFKYSSIAFLISALTGAPVLSEIALSFFW